MNCGCSARKELRGCVCAQHFTGFGASYKLTSSWTPSWPGPRADTSWALFSLYKVNYTPGGCHSLHKWGKPKVKPYHKVTCQHTDRHWGNPAGLLCHSSSHGEEVAHTAGTLCSAGAGPAKGAALPFSKQCLLLRPGLEENLWSPLYRNLRWKLLVM